MVTGNTRSTTSRWEIISVDQKTMAMIQAGCRLQQGALANPRYVVAAEKTHLLLMFDNGIGDGIGIARWLHGAVGEDGNLAAFLGDHQYQGVGLFSQAHGGMMAVQKTPISNVIKGTVKAILGFVVLQGGALPDCKVVGHFFRKCSSLPSTSIGRAEQ